MTTTAEVRSALAGAVRNAQFNGNALACSMHPTMNLDAPAAFVKRLPYDPRMVLGGTRHTGNFQVWVCVAIVDAEAAGIALDALCDPSDTNGVPYNVELEGNWPDATIQSVAVSLIGEMTEVRTDTDGYFAVPIDVEVVW